MYRSIVFYIMKRISFKIWEFEYNSETKVLACLNDTIVVTDVLEKDLQDALSMVECLYHSYGCICGNYESLLKEYQKLQISNHSEPRNVDLKKSITFHSLEFEYDSEAKVLTCLNGDYVVKDILESQIDITLYIISYFHEVESWSHIDMTYETLTGEFHVATVF